MRRDTALAAAIAASLGYAVLVGVTSSRGPKRPVSASRPVEFVITYADSAEVVRITDPAEVASISTWLDETFEARRSPFDLRKLPPPEHELQAEFATGDRITLHFSMPAALPAPVRELSERATRRQDRVANLIVVLHDGRSYTSQQLPIALRRRHGTKAASTGFGPLRGDRKQTTED